MTAHPKVEVSAIFKAKNPDLHRFIPGFIFSLIERIIYQKRINNFLEMNGDKMGIEFSRAVVDYLQAVPDVVGLSDLNRERRYVFGANHSLGGLEGIMLAMVLGDYFGKIVIPVNDILMNLENLSQLFIPLNLHGRTPRESFRRLDEVYGSEGQVLMFPSGQVSRKQKGVVKDGTWFKTFLTKAIQHQRPVVPVFVGGRNSALFYGVHWWRSLFGIKANLEMFLLPHELFRQQNKHLPLYFGQPVEPGFFDSRHSTQEWANALRDYVYLMGKGERRPFTDPEVQAQLW